MYTGCWSPRTAGFVFNYNKPRAERCNLPVEDVVHVTRIERGKKITNKTTLRRGVLRSISVLF